MLTQVKIKKLYENSILPTRGSNEAAGLDLYVRLESPTLMIKPGETVKVSVGIATEFAKGHVALVYARSGIATKKDLAPANKVPVIDSDYRGEWFIPLHNHGSKIQCIEHGERIAQVIFQEIELPEIIEAEELNDTERGEGGFGSTGTK